MKKLTFGQSKTMAQKTAMATKKGYDSGRASTGSSGASKWKAKPIVKKGTVGIKLTKKM